VARHAPINVRPDVNIAQVIQMVIGIAKTPAGKPGEIEHLVRIALDGLRYRPGTEAGARR
jgi:hypothetical protein